MSVATLFSTVMAMLTGNVSGNVQQLPPVTYAGAKERVFVAFVPLAAQPVGAVIGVARLPLGAMLTGISLITDTSLGSSTIALGDANNSALYAVAATLTTTNTPVRVGTAATFCQIITAGYDCVTGNQVTYAKPGTGGANYEDIVLTVAVAALPATGNLTIKFDWALD